ncbi:hypothetical protein RSAG8_07580, partial [Rhizoctonia solani AG-8 WAC10335]
MSMPPGWKAGHNDNLKCTDNLIPQTGARGADLAYHAPKCNSNEPAHDTHQLSCRSKSTVVQLRSHDIEQERRGQTLVFSQGQQNHQTCDPDYEYPALANSVNSNTARPHPPAEQVVKEMFRSDCPAGSGPLLRTLHGVKVQDTRAKPQPDQLLPATSDENLYPSPTSPSPNYPGLPEPPTRPAPELPKLSCQTGPPHAPLTPPPSPSSSEPKPDVVDSRDRCALEEDQVPVQSKSLDVAPADGDLSEPEPGVLGHRALDNSEDRLAAWKGSPVFENLTLAGTDENPSEPGLGTFDTQPLYASAGNLLVNKSGLDSEPSSLAYGDIDGTESGKMQRDEYVNSGAGKPRPFEVTDTNQDDLLGDSLDDIWDAVGTIASLRAVFLAAYIQN